MNWQDPYWSCICFSALSFSLGKLFSRLFPFMHAGHFSWLTNRADFNSSVRIEWAGLRGVIDLQLAPIFFSENTQTSNSPQARKPCKGQRETSIDLNEAVKISWRKSTLGSSVWCCLKRNVQNRICSNHFVLAFVSRGYEQQTWKRLRRKHNSKLNTATNCKC